MALEFQKPTAADVKAIESALRGESAPVRVKKKHHDVDLSFLDPSDLEKRQRRRIEDHIDAIVEAKLAKAVDEAKAKARDELTGGIGSTLVSEAGDVASELGKLVFDTVDAVIPGDVRGLADSSIDLIKVGSEKLQKRIKGREEEFEFIKRILIETGEDPSIAEGKASKFPDAARNEAIQRLGFVTLVEQSVGGIDSGTSKGNVRPCPHNRSIARDGSRCGKRSAESRGRTTGYDSTPEDFLFARSR